MGSPGVPTALLVALALSGCGGTIVVPCAIPQNAELAISALEGEWEMARYDAETEGTIAFTGDHVRTTAHALIADGSTVLVTYDGMWRFVGGADNEWTIELLLSGATQDGVSERFGEVTLVRLVVVFGSRDVAYALEGDGGWTVWHRLNEEEGGSDGSGDSLLPAPPQSNLCATR